MASRDSDLEDHNTKGKLHINQPFDESLEVRDGDLVPTPRDLGNHTQQDRGSLSKIVGADKTVDRFQGLGASSNLGPVSPVGKGPMSESDRRQPTPLDAARPSSLHPGSAGAGGAGLSDPRRQAPGSLGPGPTPSPAHQMISPRDEEDDEEDDESEDEDVTGPPPAGAYNPAEFEHLVVSPEVKDLFNYIKGYTPQQIELEYRLKPFIPEFIPAIGDLDAFLKVERPEVPPPGSSAPFGPPILQSIRESQAKGGTSLSGNEPLGLVVLDEPAAQQSDPTLLELQLRTFSKQSAPSKSAGAKLVEDVERNSKQVEQWVRSIAELHKSKPLPTVVYTHAMPTIDTLMQELPPSFESTLRQHALPPADLDCDIGTYAQLVCSLLDIPVYKSRVESLHLLFTLYLEFKNSEHFRDMLLGPNATTSSTNRSGKEAK